MVRKIGVIRHQTPETAEKNAIASHHACMCGCGKGHSVYRDAPREGIEKLDELTADEQFQQQASLACTDHLGALVNGEEIRDLLSRGQDPEDFGFPKVQIQAVLDGYREDDEPGPQMMA